MNTREKIRVELLQELLEEHGVSLSEEKLKDMSDVLFQHFDMEREEDMYSYPSPADFKCQKCESLKSKLEDAKNENEVYRKSVIERRGATNAYVKDGKVLYDLV